MELNQLKNELSMSIPCRVCGKRTGVMLSKLDRHPACEHCGKPLQITDADKISAGSMMSTASAMNEPIDIG